MQGLIVNAWDISFQTVHRMKFNNLLHLVAINILNCLSQREYDSFLVVITYYVLLYVAR